MGMKIIDKITHFLNRKRKKRESALHKIVIGTTQCGKRAKGEGVVEETD